MIVFAYFPKSLLAMIAAAGHCKKILTVGNTVPLPTFYLLLSLSLSFVVSEPVISILDPAGDPLHEVVMYKSKDTFPGRISCTADASWRIDPKLPKGITANGNKKNFFVIGIAEEEIARTEFTITATTSTARVNSTFFLTVMSCNDGSLFNFKGYNWLNLTYQGSVTSKKFSGWLCLQRAVYDFSILPGHSYSISDDNRVTYFSIHEHSHVTAGRIDFGDHSPPILYVSSQIRGNYTISMTVGYSYINRITNLTLFPPHPFIRIQQTLFITQTTFYEGYHVLTASNEYGSSSQEILFQLNTCDNGFYLSLTGLGMQYEIVDSKNNTLVRMPNYYCSDDTNVTIHMVDRQPISKQLRSLYVLDQNEVIADFSPTSGFYTFNLLFQPIVSSYSLFLTSNTADDNWTDPTFDDSQWMEGRGRVWNQFDGDLVFFRKHFSVYSITNYPTMFIDVIGVGEMDVYLNGAFVNHVSGKEYTSYTRIDISTQDVFIGENVFAVSIAMTTSPIVIFDAMIQMVSVTHRIQSLLGEVTEDQATPSGHPDYAFYPWGYRSWKVNSLPASLEFRFNDTAKRIVNRAFFQTPNYLITKIRIEGVDNNSSVVLYESPDDFMNQYVSYRVIDFSNPDAYSAYRILFLSATNTTLTIENIRLYRDMLPLCPKAGRVISTHAGDTVFSSCGLFYSGMKQMHCVFDGAESSWMEDRSSCLSMKPERGYAFVDFSIRLIHVIQEMFDSVVKENLRDMLVATTAARPDEISFIFTRDSTWENFQSIDIYVRVTVKRTGGDYIAEQLYELKTQLNCTVHEYIGEDIDAEFLGKVHVYLSWKPETLVLLILIVIVIIILCGFAFYGLTTFIKLRKQRIKPLKHSLANEVLLNAVE